MIMIATVMMQMKLLALEFMNIAGSEISVKEISQLNKLDCRTKNSTESDP